VPKELFEWIQERIEQGTFYNFSHAVEIGIKTLMKAEREKASSEHTAK